MNTWMSLPLAFRIVFATVCVTIFNAAVGYAISRSRGMAIGVALAMVIIYKAFCP